MTVIPPFEPHPLLRGGHAQTIFGAYFPGATGQAGARAHRVTLPDGDILVVHDDAPDAWSNGDPIAVLQHGLAGDHASGYLARIILRLHARGVRTLRPDARGWGAGAGLAAGPAHAGRSEDVRAVLHWAAASAPASRLVVAGFSLGGNQVLKMLAEGDLPDAVVRAMSVNAPIDLDACAGALETGWSRIYGRHFTADLVGHAQERGLTLPSRTPRTVREFDDRVTAPLAGYGDAVTYYARCSAGPLVGSITVPTLALTSRDDPMVPIAAYANADWPDAVRVHVADHGGHLGYVAANRDADGSRRWMDGVVVDWLTARSTRSRLTRAGSTPRPSS